VHTAGFGSPRSVLLFAWLFALTLAASPSVADTTVSEKVARRAAVVSILQARCSNGVQPDLETLNDENERQLAGRFASTEPSVAMPNESLVAAEGTRRERSVQMEPTPKAVRNGLGVELSTAQSSGGAVADANNGATLVGGGSAAQVTAVEDTSASPGGASVDQSATALTRNDVQALARSARSIRRVGSTSANVTSAVTSGPTVSFGDLSRASSAAARLKEASMAFVENRGQFDPAVRFQFKGRNGQVWITNSGLVFDVTTRSEGTRSPSLDTVGASRPALGPADRSRYVFASEYTDGDLTNMRPLEPIDTVTNYIDRSHPEKETRAARSYRAILVQSVWKGIDLRLIIRGGDIEQEFIVAPGAKPEDIRIAYRGATRLQLNRGNLDLTTPIGVLRERAPRAYQEIGLFGDVDVAFKITGQTSYTFSVNRYDSRYPLIVDPPIQFSTFLGGENHDEAHGITVDESGSIYLVGQTSSSTFPSTIGPVNPTGFAAFITKVNQDGTAIAFSTYIQSPTPWWDSYYGEAVAIDDSQNIYIAGWAAVQVNAYPTTPSAFQQCAGGIRAFITKLNPLADSILYSSCIGPSIGNPITYISRKFSIAVDDDERAYVVGPTVCGYPTTANALQQTCHAAGDQIDASLAIFDTKASGVASLSYSTYLGGSETDFGTGVALDSLRNVYISGSTRSADFPTTAGSYQSSIPPKSCQSYGLFVPCNSGFVVKLNPSLPGNAGLVYSTHLASSGGSGTEDFVFGLAVGQDGSAYLTGQTNSASFPTTPSAFKPVKVGTGTTAFVTKLEPSGNTLAYSTYLGGGGDVGYAIAVDHHGDAHVTGWTSSSAFPIADANQPTLAGGIDVFVTELNAIGSALVYSTYWGGRDADQPFAIALDSYGNATVAGMTMSGNFPTEVPLQPALLGSANAFVFRVGPGVPANGPTVSPSAGGNVGLSTVSIRGSGFSAEPVAISLVDGASSFISGANPVRIDETELVTTFDLRGATPGSRDIVVTFAGGSSLTLASAFEIVRGGGGQVVLDLLGPSVTRVDREYTFVAIVKNVGLNDVGPVTYEFGVSGAQLTGPLATTALASGTLGGIASGSFDSVSGVFRFSECSTLTFHLLDEPPADRCEPLRIKVRKLQERIDRVNDEIARILAEIARKEALRAALGCLPGVPGPSGSLCEELYWDLVELHTRLRDVQATLASLQDQLALAIEQLLECLSKNSGSSKGMQELALSGQAASEVHRTVCPLFSWDPNDKVGPSGVGTQRYVARDLPLPYTIFFENKSAATAPAQDVVVTDQLDSDLDLATFKLGDIRFGGRVIAVPAGLREFSTVEDLRPSNQLLVRVDATLDVATRIVRWHFKSLDPDTERPPSDPLAGFLPPNAIPPEGEGSVSYTVQPKNGIANGTLIDNTARIVFDTNPAIVTPTWQNVIDTGSPQSRVLSLAPTQTSATFAVAWSGQDEEGGIGSYSLFVSDNGTAFVPIVRSTPDTSVMFTGLEGHRYAFFSIAVDLVGNVEEWKAVLEAETQIVTDETAPVIVPRISGPAGDNGWFLGPVAVSWDVTDLESGVTASDGCELTAVRNDTPGVTITCRATNGAGLSAEVQTVVKIDGTAPSIHMTSTLRPADRRVVAVDLAGTVSDDLSGVDPSAVTFRVMDEYGIVQPSGPISLVDGHYSLKLKLDGTRKDKDPDARRYDIFISAADNASNKTLASWTVMLPKNFPR
jgi:hypothetical protein